MNRAFEYALKQLFDLQFESFAYRYNGAWYIWQGGSFWSWLCRILLQISKPAAYFVFSRVSRVTLDLGAKALLVTQNLHRSGDGFSIDVDYDDTALTILSINITNNSSRMYTVNAKSTSTSRTYALEIAAGQVINQSIPQNAAAKLGIFVRAGGRFDGVEWQVY